MENELFIFDLDDTLTESKQDLEKDIALSIRNLLQQSKVAIISGCKYDQLIKQFVSPLLKYCPDSRLNNLYLMPASGSQLYVKEENPDIWEKIYSYDLEENEKNEIFTIFNKACKKAKIFPINNPYGLIAEDRESQITFSFCGQQAPPEVKKSWDPDQNKRLFVATHMQMLSDKYVATVGGSSSIDVSRVGLDKKFGVLEIMGYLDIGIKDTTFIADALYEGGNDHCVIETGVKCVETKNPTQTYEFIQIMCERPTAYVVYSQFYTDTYIDKIFSTREKANEFIIRIAGNYRNNYHIKEMRLQ